MIIVSLGKQEIIESMQEIVHSIPSKYYADMLYDSLFTTAIRKSISGENISSPHSRGYVFRVFDGNKFLEVSDPDIYNLKLRVNRLISNIDYNPEIILTRYECNKIDQELPMIKSIIKIDLEEKIQKIRDFYTKMKNCDNQVVNPVISYQDSLLKRIFVNSEGSILRQVIPRTRIFLQPIVKVNGKTDFDYNIVSAEAGFELFDQIDSKIIENLVQSSIELAQAPLPPSGTMPVVLDPTLAGLIAHESFGHGLEADQIVRGRSYLKPYYKKQVASKIVNISDSPIEQGAIGSYLFDDEGIIPKKTSLIENGDFTHYLHNRLTASILKDEPRGNGRRQSFLHPVYPRMSNTFFEPGDYSIEEMIQEIKKGVLISTGYFGMEDPLGGGIQCTSRKGYLIENGEKGKMIKGITLSGNVLELLNSISAISKSAIKLDGGMCGKGSEDFVPVTSGGVYVRADKAIVSPG